MESQKSRKRERGRDGKLTNGYWNQGSHKASESQQQKRERDRNRESFSVLYVVGPRFPNVEIEGRLSGHFKFPRRITAPQFVFKRIIPLVKLRNEPLHGPLGRG